MTTQFSNSITRGFADPREPEVAVVLVPGTEVAFEREAEYQSGWGIFAKRKTLEKVARFRLVDMTKPNVHHHALEFPCGQVVLVTHLCEAQHLTVLQLPATLRRENEVTRPEPGVVLS